MPKVILTLEDTPTGVSITSDHAPMIGAPCSPAQGAAMAIVARTQREWRVQGPAIAYPPHQLCMALLDPEDLGHAATPEIRDRARQALGLPVVGGAG